MYVCAPCAYNVHPGQKRVSNPLELELQMVVSHHVGLEHGSPGRAESALNY